MYNLSATWLAHEADDWTIRSGMLEHPFEGKDTRIAQCSRVFSPPMRRRPKHVFYAFSHIDVHANANIRVKVECQWDQNKIEGTLSTWEEESKFVLLNASYVAIL